MIKEVKLTDWKSFQGTSLFIDPLTVLIGLNASGKSNALDALEFLRRVALGAELATALGGNQQVSPLRGGIEWAARLGCTQFTLEVLVEGPAEGGEYRYSLTIGRAETNPVVMDESLRLRRQESASGGASEEVLLTIVPDKAFLFPGVVAVEVRSDQGFVPVPVRRSSPALSQLAGTPLDGELDQGINAVINALRGIFILDPVPSRMRSYVPLAENLLGDGSNVAGVLAALKDAERAQAQRSFEQYLSRLAERDVLHVWAEPVGKFKKDAMLYCRERWVADQKPLEIDARSMSDGTLRFVAILTALMTRPRGSLLVIEEVDNGLHPSRARLLLEMLKKVATERGIDVLVTTHNVALLDALGPEMLPFIIAAHRDPKTGSSLLTPIQDLRDLPRLLAAAPLGRVTSQGLLEPSLARDAEEPTP